MTPGVAISMNLPFGVAGIRHGGVKRLERLLAHLLRLDADRAIHGTRLDCRNAQARAAPANELCIGTGRAYSACTANDHVIGLVVEEIGIGVSGQDVLTDSFALLGGPVGRLGRDNAILRPALSNASLKPFVRCQTCG